MPVTTAIFPDLKDSSVFITGGGSGIGAALTEGFAAQGAKVAFVDILEGSDLCDAIEAKTGNRPYAICADITDISALKSAISAAAARFGPITTLVNNAALDDRHNIDDVTEEFWNKTIDINLKPVFFSVQAVLPYMREAGHGSIINYSSTAFILGGQDMPIYSAAKAAIMGLTRSLARDHGPQNIRVNSVGPGWVLTERQKRLWATPEGLATFLARQCLPEHMAPQDMVGPTLFLASDASRMMTGQMMIVDGGVV